MAYVKRYPEDHNFRVKVGRMPDFSGSGMVQQESLIGVVDGVNRKFKLRSRAFLGSESIYKDGMLMKRASSGDYFDGDYTINYTNREIVFSKAQTPQKKSVLHASYRLM